MYYVHWRALFVIGFVFWILLCVTDLLADHKHKYFSKPVTVEDIMEDHSLIDDYVDKKLETELKQMEDSRFRFGWTLVLWNVIAFGVSFVFCSLARTVSWFLWRLYKFYRNRKYLLEPPRSEKIIAVSSISTSRIPVLVSRSTTTMKSSDNFEVKNNLSTEVSCPNLLDLNMQNFDQTDIPCQTLFRNKMFLQGVPVERNLQSQCAKLREEMLIVQATSLKEHAALSRKLEAVTREKRELSKQLAIANKENRAAKQQLEELLNEKSMLLKRLENATKEFKNNTKTKKVALAKLEEVSGNAEALKQKLEQVMRDKEILENKLRLLESEYEKLKERLRFYQSKEDIPVLNTTVPERDNSTRKETMKEAQRNNQEGDNEFITDTKNEATELQPTVSQTEIDMRKIQLKIMQLEKNLENFNPKRLEFTTNREVPIQPETDDENLQESSESATSETKKEHKPLSAQDKENESPRRTQLERSNHISPRKIKQQIQQQRTLDNIQETSETTTEPESSSDEIFRPGGRIVSSSIAFQNFLKNLNVTESPMSPYYRKMR